MIYWIIMLIFDTQVFEYLLTSFLIIVFEFQITIKRRKKVGFMAMYTLNLLNAINLITVFGTYS